MSLLERLLSPLARAEASRTWPPHVVSARWQEAEDYLRRYTNDRESRLQYTPEFSRTAYNRRIYTPLAVAREVCNFSADMLFSAEPTIVFEENEELLERVQDANNESLAQLVAYAAIIAAQGRGGFRIITDTSVNKDGVPLVTYVHEHEVIWNIQHGSFCIGGAVIIERQFTTSTGLSADVYRLVEEHTKGQVSRRLCRGSASQLGNEVPLETLDEFAGLPEEEKTGLDMPTLVKWDNVSGGYSDLTGATAVLDAIDAEVSYGREKSEKSRPVSFADKSLFDENGRIELDGILAVSSSNVPIMGQDNIGKLYGTIQPAFQSAETIAWIDFLIDSALLTMGYSKASYGRDSGGGVESGSAIKKRQWRTLIKASGKERMATEALKNALAIAMAWEDGGSSVADYRAEIKLGDPFPHDGLEEAQEAAQWNGAGAISLEEMVRMRRPDWDEEMVDAEVARIREEGSNASASGAEAPPEALARTRALFDGLSGANGTAPSEAE